jgi:hypothetical protein
VALRIHPAFSRVTLSARLSVTEMLTAAVLLSICPVVPCMSSPAQCRHSSADANRHARFVNTVCDTNSNEFVKIWKIVSLICKEISGNIG